MASTKKASTQKTKTTRKSTARARKPAAAKQTEKAKTKKADAKPKSTAADEPATNDRRASKDRRGAPDRRKKDTEVKVERRTMERRVKVNRRRQIDPTTCERDYSDEEIEFMNALEEYKRSSGRMFPTCSEVLEVFKGLGYQKRTEEEIAAENAVLDEANLLFDAQLPDLDTDQFLPQIIGQPTEAPLTAAAIEIL